MSQGENRVRALRRSAVLASTIAVTALATTFGGKSTGAWPIRPTAPAQSGWQTAPVSLRPLHTADQRIVDDLGRQVLLRGANEVALAEYWKGAEFATQFPQTEQDWADMASYGFSVVRLVVNWSKIEPTRGQYDADYLATIDSEVKLAASHGIYTVIDMHQDAYTAFLHTSDPSTCPAGTTPAKGWDGAPAWAVIDDGANTCTPGERNASPAVKAAWNNFYNNTNGIADAFVAMWGHVAGYFAGRPEVAGFDLLNEPEVPGPASEIGPKYNRLMANTINAIRAAEAGAGAPFEHLLIVEPGLPAGNPAFGLVIPDPGSVGIDTRNVVAGAHNYAESIPIAGANLTVESMNALIASVSDGIGVPVWIGEYGYWGTEAKNLDAARRQAADDDARIWGGAWWLWKNSCGDPHHISWDAAAQKFVSQTSGTTLGLWVADCTDNSLVEPVKEFLDIAGRGFVRAAPGTITSLVNDLSGRTTDVVGSAIEATMGSEEARQVIVWTPTDSLAVRSENLFGITEYPVNGGRLIIGYVMTPGCYAVHVGTETVSCPAPTTTTTITITTTTSPAPATTAPGSGSSPAAVRPKFTG